jgi:hypothetical protein
LTSWVTIRFSKNILHHGVSKYEGVSKIFGLAAWSENFKWYSSDTMCSCIAALWVLPP